MKSWSIKLLIICVLGACQKQEAQVNRLTTGTDTILPFNAAYPIVANWVLQSSKDNLGNIKTYPQDHFTSNVYTWAAHLILFENHDFNFSPSGVASGAESEFSGIYSYNDNRLTVPISLTKLQIQTTSIYRVVYLVADTLILNDSTFIPTNYTYTRCK